MQVGLAVLQEGGNAIEAMVGRRRDRRRLPHMKAIAVMKDTSDPRSDERPSDIRV